MLHCIVIVMLRYGILATRIGSWLHEEGLTSWITIEKIGCIERLDFYFVANGTKEKK